MSRRRGAGSIYKQPGCKTWSIKYYRGGKCYRESTGLTDYQAARQKLNQKLGAVADGTFIEPRIDRKRVDELAEDFLRDYRINARKSLGHAEARWEKHLQPFFGNLRVADVSTTILGRYVDERIKAGAKNATINRELAALKRMFRLGYYSTPPKVLRLPLFPKLQENNVRKGFLKDGEYNKLASEAAKEGLWFRALLAVAYNFGWRKSELLNLRVCQVDLATRTILLEVGETKNDAGRTVKMPDEVFTLLSSCVTGKRPEDFVFTREDGKPVKSFRKAWRNVCKRAGVPGLLLHDLRRTGVRNLRRLGVAESVAMKISGHKTASIFRRYDITDEADLADAAAKLDAKRKERAVEIGHDFGHDSTPGDAETTKTRPN